MRRAWLTILILLAGCAERSFVNDRSPEEMQAEEQALSDAEALRELREEAQRPAEAPSDSASKVRGAATP